MSQDWSLVRRQQRNKQIVTNKNNKNISFEKLTKRDAPTLGLKPQNNKFQQQSQSNNDDVIIDGVRARTFPKWRGPVPCFEPERLWWQQQGYLQPTRVGLLLAKTHKTASTTAASIHLRIARNQAAQRQRQSQASYPICQARFDHLPRPREAFPQRDRAKSFLWTILRDPVQRLVSSFFFFQVTRQQVQPLDRHFQQYLESPSSSSVVGPNYYADWLSLGSSSMEHFDEDPAKFINHLLDDYDFLAVSNRMDESAVALSMLLNVPLADVLFISSKMTGSGFDLYKGNCSYIVPSFVSPGMQQYFETPKFQRLVHWDKVLHRIANASLDLTIDKTLGRAAFEENLQRFRKAQRAVAETCANQVAFPCSASGRLKAKPMTRTNCLWADAGCGFPCLDRIATEFGLWGSFAPLNISRIRRTTTTTGR